jgi:hypothetical protein
MSNLNVGIVSYKNAEEVFMITGSGRQREKMEGGHTSKKIQLCPILHGGIGVLLTNLKSSVGHGPPRPPSAYAPAYRETFFFSYGFLLRIKEDRLTEWSLL